MQTSASDATAAIFGDAFDLATWNVERTTDQLMSFINAKNAALPDDIDLYS